MPSYKDKSGKWYCQFYFIDWDGQRKHTSKHGFARKKDADDYERSFKTKAKKQDVSMEELLDAYKAHLYSLVQLGTIKIQTADNYWDTIERSIRPFFKDVRNIANITPARINTWLAEASKGQRVKDKLMAGSIRNIKSRMNQIMTFAQRNYGLHDNPVFNSERIKNDGRQNRRVSMWPLETYQKFRDVVPNQPMKIFYDVLYFAGLRVSEAAVLTPKCIQPFKLIVTSTYVAKTRSTPTGHKDRPKSLASIREVQIPRFLYYELEDYISRLYKVKPDEPIFPFGPKKAQFLMRYLVLKHDLPYASPHTLRHSYASLLLKVTKDAAVVSHQIGHANPKITLSVYSHMVPGEDRLGVDKLEEYMFPTQTIGLEKPPEK